MRRAVITFYLDFRKAFNTDFLKVVIGKLMKYGLAEQ